MNAVSSANSFVDLRQIDRDPVHFRARSFGPAAREQMLVVVNLSPHGLMARTEQPFAAGDRLRIALPVQGVVAAEVRWALGGRIGCRFDVTIDPASYYEMLADVVQSGRQA